MLLTDLTNSLRGTGQLNRLQIRSSLVKILRLSAVQPVNQEAINISSNDLIQDSITQNEVTIKRIPIGSQPEFALPDDSTIETPMQRRILWAHFSLLFYNIYLVGSSLDFSSYMPMESLKYVFLIMFSVVLGDFAVNTFQCPKYMPFFGFIIFPLLL